jgi:hypothetical protein
MIAARGNELVRTRTAREEIGTIARCFFTRLVALHCRLSGHEPDPRDLDQWLAAVWPMVTEEMWPKRWARAYLQAMGLVTEEAVIFLVAPFPP